MPYLIPESAPSRATRGEKLVFESLRSHLPDSCTAWYNLPLKGRAGLQQPDFILLGDEIGLTVLEVKDWDVRHILHASPTTWQVQFSTGIENHINPILQAKGYATAIADHFKRTHSPVLVEPDGLYQGRLRFPFNYWAVFPFMTCAELDGWPELKATLDMRYVLLRDHLGSPLFDNLCAQTPFTAALTLEQIQAIRRVLFPEVCITAAERPAPLLDLDQE